MNDQISSLTIRRLDAETDAAALARLAELDSAEIPAHPALGVEVEGRLLAAVSLVDGASLADPFSRTAELRALLELRAAQLRRRASRPVAIRGARRPTAALPSSVPGAGGRLLTLRP